MAEIHLQRKTPRVWPAMLAALALVALVWTLAAVWAVDEDERGQPDEVAQSLPPVPEIALTSGVTPTPPEVAAFLTFSETSAGEPSGPAHDYAAAGMRRLSAALETIARNEGVTGENVRQRLHAFRRTAERIQADPAATAHSNRVRDAFMNAANLMAAMQQDHWPNAAEMRSALEEVRTAAGAIEPNRPLLDQVSDVGAFFDRAAVVVREMGERT